MRAILTFHSIDDSGSVLSYPARTLAKLLAAHHRVGLPILDLDTLLMPQTSRGVALTFDDGIRSVFDQALPILRDHAVPAHLFLTTGSVGKTNRWPSQPVSTPRFEMLRWPEIEALHKAGVHIESHTETHRDLRRLTDAEIAGECDNVDAAIVRRFGMPPQYFAYPYGAVDSRVASQVRGRYRASVTTQMRPLQHTDDLAMLPRIDAYYLRSEAVLRNLTSASTQAYLAVRGGLRRIRAMW